MMIATANVARIDSAVRSRGASLLMNPHSIATPIRNMTGMVMSSPTKGSMPACTCSV